MSSPPNHKGFTGRSGRLATVSAVVLVVSLSVPAGAQVAKMTSPTSNDLYAVWGSASDQVYAVGEAATILEYDGNGWYAMPHAWTGGDFRGVWGTAWDNVYVVGDDGTILLYRGTNWLKFVLETTENLNSIWGSGPNDIFAVGDNGTILHYDGSNWSAMNSGTTWDWDDVWGSGPNDVYAVGYWGVVHYDGSKWSTVSTPSGTVYTLSGVWGSAPDDFYAVGSSAAAIEYDGSSWSWMFTGQQGSLGSGWATRPLPSFLDIWGSGPSDIWIVGTYTTVLQYDGSTLTIRSFDNIESNPGPPLYGVWGDGWGSNVYAVGQGGLILVYRRNLLMVVVEILPAIVHLFDPNLIEGVSAPDRYELRDDLGLVDVAYDGTGHATLSATSPDPGATFSHWEGDVPPGHEQDNPLTVDLEGGGLKLRAVFAGAAPPGDFGDLDIPCGFTVPAVGLPFMGLALLMLRPRRRLGYLQQ